MSLPRIRTINICLVPHFVSDKLKMARSVVNFLVRLVAHNRAQRALWVHVTSELLN